MLPGRERGGQRRARYIQNKHFCTYSICSAYSEHILRPAAFPNTRKSLDKTPMSIPLGTPNVYSIKHTKSPYQMYNGQYTYQVPYQASIQYTECLFQTAHQMSIPNVHLIHFSKCPFQGLNLQDLTASSLRMQWPCNCIHLRTLLLQQEYGTGVRISFAQIQFFLQKRGWCLHSG